MNFWHQIEILQLYEAGFSVILSNIYTVSQVDVQKVKGRIKTHLISHLQQHAFLQLMTLVIKTKFHK